MGRNLVERRVCQLLRIQRRKPCRTKLEFGTLMFDLLLGFGLCFCHQPFPRLTCFHCFFELSQYFGNAVTCEWWDEIWLNEGFARFYQYIGIQVSEPDWQVVRLATPIAPYHKSHNALDKYPKMHHFVTEMCTCVHISVQMVHCRMIIQCTVDLNNRSINTLRLIQNGHHFADSIFKSTFWTFVVFWFKFRWNLFGTEVPSNDVLNFGCLTPHRWIKIHLHIFFFRLMATEFSSLHGSCVVSLVCVQYFAVMGPVFFKLYVQRW